jgi:probable O-glycosylation ligase (exosortase A-associated)
MRDIVLTVVVFLTLPFILRSPEIGIYVYSWLSYMNPHRLTWGFAYDFPFAYIVAVTFLISLFISNEAKKIPWSRETIVLTILILWMIVTTFFAVHQDIAWKELEKVLKIQLMIYATLMIINSQQRIRILVWVIVLSLGFYGIKGGIFTIIHGGAYRVQGPAGTFIGGNNELALALIMTIPLMRFLQMYEKQHWVRVGLGVAMVLTAIAMIGSQSRGALLGAVAMGGFLWLKSRNKIFTGMTIGIAVLLVLSIMPESWHERIATIENYQQDQSAMGRINAWHFAYNLAKDRPLVGGGFDAFKRDLFRIYAPDPTNVHDSHSIYFEMLGEHGFVGLGLFLLLGFGAWFTANSVIRRTKRDPEKKWLADLVAMCQVTLIGYATGGAFLGLSYFDLFYHLIALIVIANALVAKMEADEKQAARDAKAAQKVLRQQTTAASPNGRKATAPASSAPIS